MLKSRLLQLSRYGLQISAIVVGLFLLLQVAPIAHAQQEDGSFGSLCRTSNDCNFGLNCNLDQHNDPNNPDIGFCADCSSTNVCSNASDTCSNNGECLAGSGGSTSGGAKQFGETCSTASECASPYVCNTNNVCGYASNGGSTGTGSTASSSNAGNYLPLVMCGRHDAPYNNPCGICDLFKMAKNILDFTLYKGVPLLATLAIVVAGLMMVLGGYDPSFYSQGMKLLQGVLIGLILVFSAWLLTNTLIKFLAKDQDVSTHWYEFQCKAMGADSGTGSTTGTGDGSTGGTTNTPTPTPTPITGAGAGLTCNVAGLPKNPANCSDAGKCPDCKALKKDPSKQEAQSLADLLNNTIDPQFASAGITYRIAEAMCPNSRHASCAHFNGHAVDLGSSGGNLLANLSKACEILNAAGLRGATGESSGDRGVYVLEASSPGGACPAVCGGRAGACGSSPIHLQY